MTSRTKCPAGRVVLTALFGGLVGTAAATGVQMLTELAQTAERGLSLAPTVKNNLDLPVPGSPRISPDGRHILYLQSRTNWDANAFEQDVWEASASGATPPRKLNFGTASLTAVEWSPDGHWVAVLGAIHGAPAEIMLTPAEGGDTATITAVAGGVTAFQWSPDSKRIAFIADDTSAPPATGHRPDDAVTVVGEERSSSSIWMLAVPARVHRGMRLPAPARLTSDPFTVADLAFSPKGDALAFSAQRGPGQRYLATSTIYTVTLADSKVVKLVDTPGPHYSPLWSPDGDFIAYVTSSDPRRYFYANARLAVVQAHGGPSRVFTEAFDEDAQPVAWREEGIYFNALQRTDSALFLLNPVTSALRKITADGMTVTDTSVSNDGRVAATLCAQPDHALEVCAYSLADGIARPVTSLDTAYERFSKTTREVVHWKAPDGQVIEGVLEKPADFKPGKAYPLLVIIHGGPQWLDTPYRSPDHMYPAEQFLARGALVLRPNYRGSAGYGGAFRSLNYRNLGVGDSQDVLSGVDFLVKAGLVDSKRIGVMGWSAGGFISAFLTTTTTGRFRAVSVGAGISDYATFYETSDLTDLAVQYLGDTPWKDPRIYDNVSPISHASGATTPTLIQHGALDMRVPLSQASELDRALVDHNVPVRMVIYDKMAHAPTTPTLMQAVMEENLRWFGHYLWGDSLAPGNAYSVSE